MLKIHDNASKTHPGFLFLFGQIPQPAEYSTRAKYLPEFFPATPDIFPKLLQNYLGTLGGVLCNVFPVFWRQDTVPARGRNMGAVGGQNYSYYLS